MILKPIIGIIAIGLLVNSPYLGTVLDVTDSRDQNSVQDNQLALTPAYAQSDFLLDTIDDNPDSIQDFVENGFQIYTFLDSYGDYYIPYKVADVELNSITFDYDGKRNNGYLLADVNAKNNSTLTLVIPRLLADVGHGYDDDLQIFSVGRYGNVNIIEQKDDIHYFFVRMNLSNDTTNLFIANAIPMATNSPEPLREFNSKTTDSIYFDIFPPKKQIQNNIPVEEILCKKDLELLKKQRTNTPACVTYDTKEELLVRGGWILAR